MPALWEAVHRRIIDEVEERGPFFAAAFDQMRELNRRLDSRLGHQPGLGLFRQAHQALGGRLRLAVSGGAALPQRVAEFFNDIGIHLLEGYGLTEAAPVLSTARPDEPLMRRFGRQAIVKASEIAGVRSADGMRRSIGEIMRARPQRDERVTIAIRPPPMRY